MDNFLPIKSNHRAAPLRLAARLISIMILAFLWPARGGAQEQTLPDLNVSNITDATTLTYEEKPGTDTYAWYYKIGTNGSEVKFSGTLTGSKENDCPVITIKSEKVAASPNYDDCAKLILNGVKLTAVAEADLFIIGGGTKPLCIQATSESTLKCKATGTNAPYVIKNNNGGILLLDGGTAGLNIIGEGGGSRGIYLFSNGPTVNGILKGKIDIVADRAVNVENASRLSVTDAAEVRFSSWTEATCVLRDHIISPFLEWRFESAPESGKTLEIKDANGKSFDPAIQFTTDGNNKNFAVNVTKSTGYTVWLGDKKLMDENETTVFTVTSNELVYFSRMQTYLAKNWPDYGQTANVGADGTDVAVSGANYTVKTPRGLAWVAWVTNNAKAKEGNANETHTDYYPASAGFKNCTVTLANDISLAKPKGVTADFVNNWVPIGTYSFLSYTDYTKCFQGTFDGNDKTITGMTISSSSVEYIGLFGYLHEATVKNLTMVDGEGSDNIKLTSITGSADIYPLGSIAGHVENGKIINCHNRCAVSFSVSEKSGKVGGIAGSIKNSVLSACSNSGAITLIQGKASYGGGIVGANNQSSIVSCFNTGNINVTADEYIASAGGIMGSDDSYNEGNNILYCYSTGDITSKGTQSIAAGSIVGYALCAVIKSCFATGTVSAESSSSSDEACAGGIIGWIWSGRNNSVTVENCLALNTGGVKATGTTSKKQAGRIVGKNNDSGNGKVTLSNNYASTNIQLTVGNNTFAPTADIAADAINGADTFLDEIAAEIAGWAGEGNAFTAIDTTVRTGLLPQLKAIASYGDDGLPISYNSELIPGQPSDLISSTYLAFPEPLALSSNDTETITLFCSEGKWSSKQGEGRLNRFNGTVKMGQAGATSTNKLVIAIATGNPTLTFDKVEIKPTDGAALAIEAGCGLTLNTTGGGISTLLSTNASTLVNKGSLTLTGKDLYIGNTGTTDTHYGLDNSGTFTVTDDPSSTSVTIHCANTAIHNTGTLANAWMEWRFKKAWESYEDIAFAAPDDASLSPASLLRQGKTFATTVTAGKTYKLWKVTNAGGEVRTPQKGLDGNGKPVKLFSAVANAVTVYKEVEDVKTIEITDARNFSEAECAAQDVVVESNGVLTVDADNAFVFNLKLEAGAQLVTRKALKVSETFELPTRTLENKWTTFGSPVALTASVGNGGNLLYAATGYTGMDAKSQGWDNISGTTATGTETADLAADTPYLLAAEAASTTVTFTATASADQPIEIPSAATVTLGEALANGTFLFQTNPNLTNLTLSGIYVLNDEGTRFVLKTDDYVVKPFEAFIVANAVTRARVTSLSVGGDIATGIEQPLATGATRVWGTRRTLHISADAPVDVRVVTPSGQTLRALKVSAGDTTLALPAGIYFVRCNGITYKVSL